MPRPWPRGRASPDNAAMAAVFQPPSLTVRHYGAAPGAHVHDHFQVLWSLEGVLELEVAGRGMALSRGQGLVLCPGERHGFESRTGSCCLVLDTCDASWDPCGQPHRARARQSR